MDKSVPFVADIVLLVHPIDELFRRREFVVSPVCNSARVAFTPWKRRAFGVGHRFVKRATKMPSTHVALLRFETCHVHANDPLGGAETSLLALLLAA